MQFVTYQVCLTGEGWQPVKVASSDGKSFYIVLVNPWGVEHENVCECKGYMHRGQCRHQLEASDRICAWEEGDNEIQTDAQQRDKICPRCGGPTKYVFEVIQK
jgi:hypothetical protein